MHSLPRSEYPRPQMRRASYLCLNGEWQFEIDHGNSGRERGLVAKEALDSKIIVPFCPESKLSGVGYTDFMAAVWYKRTVSLNANGLRTILHIDACDFKTEVWLNGKSCGVHFGGSSPISLDITDKVIDGDNVITICAEDDTRSGCQPLGKLSFQYASKGCH